MSDELKPCPFCGGEVKLKADDSGGYSIECGNHGWPKGFTQGIPSQTIAGDVLMCSWGQGKVAKHALIEAWNARADDAQVIKNAENYKLADDSGPQVIANAEKHELADSREKLEADVDALFKYQTLRDSLVKHVVGLLDRQAAITRRETDEIRDCADCAEGMLANMQRQIDSLTAERDELERANSRQARKIHDVCELNEKLTAERDMLHCANDSLRKKLREKQHVCDVQRDSFLKLEAENAELRRMLADAAEAI